MTTSVTPIDRVADRQRPARRALRALGWSLRAAWLLVRIALVIAAVAVAVAWHRFGYAPLAVQTGSMTPTFPVHTLLFVHDVPAADVRVGDVITFDPPGSVPRTSHRVVHRELHDGKWYFETKGDANPAADDWRAASTSVTSEAAAKTRYLRGITYPTGTAVRTEFHVPYVGWLAQVAGLKHARMALVLFPFLVVALLLLQWIWRAGTPKPTDERDDDADGGTDGDTGDRDVATPGRRPAAA